ncbi:sugar ABC transporter, permease protein [Candidatus Vecturithrix granuli]|uniref:Sugar ABC transporter, permease protein n=1 Tax=Vecturithrix granuli TaxID=1499967 RepID=A0A081BX86_VECG1|nr:sugar ABC transporter, permease protein [Candidatus Vecturithrix granuli]
MLRSQQNMYKLFVAPAIVITLVFLFIPISNGVKMSFTNLDFIKNTNKFVGLSNYEKIFTDLDFYKAIGRTIIYVVVVVFFNFIIGYTMALICAQEFRGNRILRGIIVLPMLLIPTAAAVLWRFMYNYDVGVINKLLAIFRIHGPNWLGDPKLSLLSILITDIWAWTPWMFLILFAGIEGLPKETLEAGVIDGATYFQLVRYIMTPMLRPITRVAISLKAIDTFRTFDYVWVMTRGGPASSSDIMSTYVYNQAFKHLKYGYSAALSLVVLLIMVLLSFLTLRKFILTQAE